MMNSHFSKDARERESLLKDRQSKLQQNARKRFLSKTKSSPAIPLSSLTPSSDRVLDSSVLQSRLSNLINLPFRDNFYESEDNGQEQLNEEIGRSVTEKREEDSNSDAQNANM